MPELRLIRNGTGCRLSEWNQPLVESGDAVLSSNSSRFSWVRRSAVVEKPYGLAFIGFDFH